MHVNGAMFHEWCPEHRNADRSLHSGLLNTDRNHNELLQTVPACVTASASKGIHKLVVLHMFSLSGSRQRLCRRGTASVCLRTCCVIYAPYAAHICTLRSTLCASWNGKHLQGRVAGHHPCMWSGRGTRGWTGLGVAWGGLEPQPQKERKEKKSMHFAPGGPACTLYTPSTQSLTPALAGGTRARAVSGSQQEG